MSENGQPRNCALVLVDCYKSYRIGRSNAVVALRGVSCEVNAGEFVVVVGANGSGKSTLLNVIAGDQFPDTGRILIKSEGRVEQWTRVPRWKRAMLVGRVHQDPRRGTVADLTVQDNFRLASLSAAWPSMIRFSNEKKADEQLRERLAQLGLGDKWRSRVGDLSHGQRQLVALELAMVRRPSLMLLDEHTASLDRQNAAHCMEVTHRLWEEMQTTIIMVTHNLADAVQFGCRLIVLRDGKVHADLSGHVRKAIDLAGLVELCGYQPRAESS